MPDASAWAESDGKGLLSGKIVDRAHAAWSRILERPTALTVRRAGSDLTEQTVRVEIGNGGNGDTTSGVANQVAVIFGVRNHPTVANTDLQRGDRFFTGGQEFIIEIIILTAGELQAQAKVKT